MTTEFRPEDRRPDPALSVIISERRQLVTGQLSGRGGCAALVTGVPTFDVEPVAGQPVAADRAASGPSAAVAGQTADRERTGRPVSWLAAETPFDCRLPAMGSHGLQYK
jgi:hypothetical protein